MATVIAFANQKGGVGKTTLSTQLAYYLKTRKRAKVLFLDMDAQGSATETLLEAGEFTGTRSQALFDDDCEAVRVQKTPRGIDLIGSEPSAEAFDVEALPIEQVLNPKKNLGDLFEQYDYVVLDCPPSLGRRLAAALILADFVVCPVKLSGYAVSGLKGLFDTILQISQNANPKLQILGVAVNEFQDTGAQREAFAAVNEALPGYLFKTPVRSRSPIDYASRGMPIQEVRNGARAADEMKALYDEMLKRIKKLSKGNGQ